MQKKGISLVIASSLVLFGTAFTAHAQTAQSENRQLAMVRIESTQPRQAAVKIENKETVSQPRQIDQAKQVKQLIAEQKQTHKKAPSLLLDPIALAQVVQDDNLDNKLAAVSHLPSTSQEDSDASLVQTCSMESGSEAPCLTWQWR